MVVLLGTTLIVAWEPAHSKLRPRQLKYMLRHSLAHISNGFLCMSGLSQETVFLLLKRGAFGHHDTSKFRNWVQHCVTTKLVFTQFQPDWSPELENTF